MIIHNDEEFLGEVGIDPGFEGGTPWGLPAEEEGPTSKGVIGLALRFTPELDLWETYFHCSSFLEMTMIWNLVFLQFSIHTCDRDYT
jgi:hypothetical protein